MQWDREDAETRAKHRDDALAAWLKHDLRFSAAYRERFQQAGARFDAARLADLASVPPTEWDDVRADPGTFVVRPQESELVRHGARPLVLSISLAKVLRRRERINREVVDPVYKPVLWHLDDGVPVGSTERDLELLGEMGARMFSLAGLSRYDVLAGLTGPEPTLAHWQTVLGARVAQLSALHLGPAPDAGVLAGTGATVLAGGAAALAANLAALRTGRRRLPQLHTLLVVGEWPDAGERDALAMAAAAVSDDGPPAVVAAWAPRGARALWAECREGPGLHTYPDAEILEVQRADGKVRPTGEGELLWTALGWRGTAGVRLRSGVAANVAETNCPACGRRGPVVLSPGRAGVSEKLRTLARDDDVTAFQIELRRVNGSEELLVFLSLGDDAELSRVLGDLNRGLRATQYVVLPKRDVERRVKAAGSRVVDLR